MKTGKGVVKKYSREYNRTLKNGEKKKYTTKQIQITIPKHDDIYEDKEEPNQKHRRERSESTAAARLQVRQSTQQQVRL